MIQGLRNGSEDTENVSLGRIVHSIGQRELFSLIVLKVCTTGDVFLTI